MTKHRTRAGEMARRSPLLTGEIVFDEGPVSLAHVPVHIFLEDTTLADAPARVVVHQVLENLSAGAEGRIPFALEGAIADKHAQYTVRVWVDMDGDGRVSHGDFISTISYPVLTGGYPKRVVVHVRRVR